MCQEPLLLQLRCGIKVQLRHPVFLTIQQYCCCGCILHWYGACTAWLQVCQSCCNYVGKLLYTREHVFRLPAPQWWCFCLFGLAWPAAVPAFVLTALGHAPLLVVSIWTWRAGCASGVSLMLSVIEALCCSFGHHQTTVNALSSIQLE